MNLKSKTIQGVFIVLIGGVLGLLNKKLELGLEQEMVQAVLSFGVAYIGYGLRSSIRELGESR